MKKKKINFKAITAAASYDGDTRKIDVAGALSAAFFQFSTNYDQHDLGRQIHAAAGEIEIDEAQAEMVKAMLPNTALYFFAQEAVLNALNELFKEV